MSKKKSAVLPIKLQGSVTESEIFFLTVRRGSEISKIKTWLGLKIF